MRSVQSDVPQDRPSLHAYGIGATLEISKEAKRVIRKVLVKLVIRKARKKKNGSQLQVWEGAGPLEVKLVISKEVKLAMCKV